MSNQADRVQAYRAQEQEQLETQFLKGTKDTDLGVYCDLFAAKTSVAGQDGGVVTSLLLKGFREGLFDAAIVVRRLHGYMAAAVIAENPETVLSSKGTTYVKVNVSKKLRELVSQGKKRIAIVATPCEVRAVRKIQQTIGKDSEITVIGLFCYQSFNPIKLKEAIKKQLGIDLDKANKTEISKGKFTATVDGKAVTCKVKEVDGASEASCRFCDDFTAQLADVSVGSVGSPEGYSTVIVRSPAGERLVRNNDYEKGVVNREEIAKLAKYKKERSKKSFTEQKTP